MNSLSTFVDYTIKGPLREVTLKEKNWYELIDMNGYYYHVQLVKVRMVEGKPVVYFRKNTGKSKLFGMIKMWSYQVMSLDSFKALLADLGSVTSLHLKVDQKIR